VSQAVSSPTVSLSPTSINFGNIIRGSSQTKGVTITNTSSVTLLNLSWSISGGFSQFTVSSTTCGTVPAKLNAGASCVINVRFQPSFAGNQTAKLSLSDYAANSPQTVNLNGSGK
jgi:hypothetical protein